MINIQKALQALILQFVLHCHRSLWRHFVGGGG